LKSVADYLADTREYIDQKGWTQGRYRDLNTGAVCSLGGIQQVLVQDGVDLSTGQGLRLFHTVAEAFAKVVRTRISSTATIAVWNDTPTRTKQEVLDAFAKAEKIERAGFDPDAQ